MNNSDNSSFSERRVHSRHVADLRVQLIRSDTVPLQLHMVGLSSGGMHVECDRAQAQLLAPPDIGEGQQFTARIMISAPGMQRCAMTLSVIVKSVTELVKDRYRVGFHFLQFFGKNQDLLEEFIAALED